ncbi:MAG: hypothetical protein OXH76_03150 [Boseongicola sp.]|nr:hypothetical protein [Boseongicola sp.]
MVIWRAPIGKNLSKPSGKLASDAVRQTILDYDARSRTVLQRLEARSEAGAALQAAVDRAVDMADTLNLSQAAALASVIGALKEYNETQNAVDQATSQLFAVSNFVIEGIRDSKECEDE